MPVPMPCMLTRGRGGGDGLVRGALARGGGAALSSCCSCCVRLAPCPIVACGSMPSRAPTRQTRTPSGPNSVKAIGMRSMCHWKTFPPKMESVAAMTVTTSTAVDATARNAAMAADWSRRESFSGLVFIMAGRTDVASIAARPLEPRAASSTYTEAEMMMPLCRGSTPGRLPTRERM